MTLTDERPSTADSGSPDPAADQAWFARLAHFSARRRRPIMALWLVLVLRRAITQQSPVRDLIFEVTSALGTVGLSTGATAHLDGIGKIIIMWAMFIGRIGPMTLFMLLSEEHSPGGSSCPDAHVTLT